ncbi:DUF368 domain-containing protein [Brevibacterium gallinarum]|uniref:DUF368 domain-containing protein n=1 Tax=Brevibacterium gallinarum TaxID=2762220 RepID=A0ABR8WW54_9MICO|nr:DUF368 domain-containing protein [Brevibacterium gallinarum]MBD8021183.1 DUF368 domain-containing protein [Brevibacterium gallinarum]
MPHPESDQHAVSQVRRAPRRPVYLLPLDLLRGFLIGMAELVPGVSGGTIALVTGIYDELIGSASHVVSAVKRLILGPDRIAGMLTELRRTQWMLIIPVLIGMATAVLSIAGVMKDFVTAYPEHSRGLFFGLVLVSILVPLRMLPARRPGQHRITGLLLFILAAAAAFIMVGFAGGGNDADPSLIVVFFAAAVAICALVIPGVSGSFFLLAVGLYATTMTAISERDLGYIAIFGLGAIFGLASFVSLLRYLLTHRRRATLLVMAGLMFGSLRALWPWQSEGTPDASGETHGVGDLILPTAPIAGPVLLALAGAAAVLILILVEARYSPVDHDEELDIEHKPAR